MTLETQHYIDIAHRVAATARAGSLKPETAVQFCQVILPDLLVELEIAKRVDERLSAQFAPVPQPAPETPAASPKRAKKKAVKKPSKKKKGAVKDDRPAS